MTCSQVSKSTSMRHDSIRDILRRVHAYAGLCTSSEPPYRQLRGARGSQGKEGLHRADLLSILPGGRHVMADVTVIHPLGVKVLPGAARTEASAAVAAEQRKQTEWEAFVDKPQYEFVPFAIESYGRLGPKAVKHIRELGEIAASSGRVSKSVFVMNAYKLISCAVQKGNSLMFAQSLTAIARSTGWHFLPGLDVPVQEF